MLLTARVDGDERVVAILEVGLLAKAEVGGDSASLIAGGWAGHDGGSDGG